MANLKKIVESAIENTSQPDQFLRIRCGYYKIVYKTDRYGQTRKELIPWKKEEIKQDYDEGFLKSIPKFDDAVMVPDNFDHQPVIGSCFNRYSEIGHKPHAGEWTWTKTMLMHIFGEQFELGIRYLHILICWPQRQLPILALVSKARATGKTTFVNWLDMILGPNLVIISSQDLASSFNAYATANVIVIEETLIEKALSVEKLKSLTTAKTVILNEKYVAQIKLPFYGKVILTSNNEDRFAKIDQEEVRFFVRKLPKPQNFNANIETELFKEIPAFLHYLRTLPEPDFTTDRSGFTPDELNNKALQALKTESKSGLFHDLMELFTDHFANNTEKFVMCSVLDIKNKWFNHDNSISHRYLKRVITEEFGLKVERLQRYSLFGGLEKTGRPYKFEKQLFIKNGDEHEALPF